MKEFTLFFSVEHSDGATRVVELDHLVEAAALRLREVLRGNDYNTKLVCTESCEVIVE